MAYHSTGLRLPDLALSAARTIAASFVEKASPAASSMTEVVETKDAFASLFPILHELIPEPWGWFRLVLLRPSQQIVAHQDAPIAKLRQRYHLPLSLNAGCWVYHAGVWRQLQTGHLYQMDPTDLHGAVNWGGTIRVHLLIDQMEF